MSRLRRMWTTGALSVVFCITGCASPFRVVPIQLTRVVQMEQYTQKFTVPVDRAAQTYEALIGANNFEALRRKFGSNEVMEALEEQRVEVNGHFTMSLYPDPTTLREFELELSGRYFLTIRSPEREREILLSGDFVAANTRFSIEQLHRGEPLVFEVNLITSRIPQKQTYQYQTALPLRYHIRVDSTLADDEVFSIDYAAIHGVTLGDQQIAELRISGPPPGVLTSKLVDLRGLKFVRRDYRALFGGIHSRRRPSAGDEGHRSGPEASQ